MENPAHIGIILDGNRRWARQRNLPTYDGHLEGFNNLKRIVTYANEKGLKMLSVFVFSKENWNRSKAEVTYLMDLIEKVFDSEKEFLDKIKVRVVGERLKISDSIKKKIEKIEADTAKHTGMILNIAFSYSGKEEIIETVKNLIKQGVSLTEENLEKNLLVPNIDLVIRTGFEQRLSNFFIWQTAYSELYFPQKYWPDFSEQDFDLAIEEYNNRQRRFGK